MQTSTELKNLLARIDRKGYPAYKDTKGVYRFPEYELSIDRIQGDPFAERFRSLSIRVPGAKAAFPPDFLTLQILQAARPAGCVDPSVWPAGYEVFFSG